MFVLVYYTTFVLVSDFSFNGFVVRTYRINIFFRSENVFWNILINMVATAIQYNRVVNVIIFIFTEYTVCLKYAFFNRIISHVHKVHTFFKIYK